METTPQKSNTTTAVSFDNKSNLTDAQTQLLELLEQSILTNTVINTNVMLDFYLSNIKGGETYILQGSYFRELDPVSNRYVNKWRYFDEPKVQKWRDEYNIKMQARQWFKTNLGAVILKGKVLILPVIES